MYMRGSPAEIQIPTMKPDCPLYYRPAACVIAQQYSSAAFVLLLHHFRNGNDSAFFKKCYCSIFLALLMFVKSCSCLIRGEGCLIIYWIGTLTGDFWLGDVWVWEWVRVWVWCESVSVCGVFVVCVWGVCVCECVCGCEWECVCVCVLEQEKSVCSCHENYKSLYVEKYFWHFNSFIASKRSVRESGFLTVFYK
jgi:hypothetical protein